MDQGASGERDDNTLALEEVHAQPIKEDPGISSGEDDKDEGGGGEPHGEAPAYEVSVSSDPLEPRSDSGTTLSSLGAHQDQGENDWDEFGGDELSLDDETDSE